MRAGELPRGRMPKVEIGALIAALHRRRERRKLAAGEMRDAVLLLSASVERHLARIAALRATVEARGDMSALEHFDAEVTRLRAELHAAEHALAEALAPPRSAES